MTSEEINALVALEQTIDRVGKDLEIVSKGNRLDIRVSYAGNLHNIFHNKVQGLDEKLSEIIENSLQEYYDELIMKKRQLVLCKEGHATNFTPTDILEKNGKSE